MSTRLAEVRPGLEVARCRSESVAQVVEGRLGRPVQARLMSQATIAGIAESGLGRLCTRGPVLHRRVLLTDSVAPRLPVAVAWALIVTRRLPKPVRADLHSGGEPLDRLLSAHQVAWTADVGRGGTQRHRVERGLTAVRLGRAGHRAHRADPPAQRQRGAAPPDDRR